MDIGGTLLSYFSELWHSFIIGVPSYILVHAVIKLIKRQIHATERGSAIWHHYHYRAKGQGHEAKKVTQCKDGLCQLIGG